jgi:glutathione peroxidase
MVNQNNTNHDDFYSISARRIDGSEESMEQYRDKWILVVNVASKCGFTPQYSGLEKLYQDFRGRGFVILGFPCNQFMGQEPASDSEILGFCSTRYQVSFPMFSKIDVNGPATHEVYRFLKQQARSWLGFQRIGWNFTKFLVHPDGRTVERFSPTTTPAAIGNRLSTLMGDQILPGK